MAMYEKRESSSEHRFNQQHLSNQSEPSNVQHLIRSSSTWTSAKSMLSVLIAVSLVLGVAWRLYLQPHWQKEQDYAAALHVSQLGNVSEPGHSQSFDGVRLENLDEALIPGGSNDKHGNRRLIFVGDIHGCLTELKTLLRKVDFNTKSDHLIATGDVISKGPDSPGVLDELIRLKAISIRGNHEDRVLHHAKAALDDSDELLPQTDKDKSPATIKTSNLLGQLTKEHIRFLRDMPLMLRIPPLPAAAQNSEVNTQKKKKAYIKDEILVVHAGLVPGITLAKQDPFFVMNMRTMNRRTHKPSIVRDQGDPWYEIWNWYQNRLAARESFWSYFLPRVDFMSTENLRNEGRESPVKSQVVVYGHDSRARLQNHRWSKGLDTGCVNGDRLTAMILDARGHTGYVSVQCKNHRS